MSTSVHSSRPLAQWEVVFLRLTKKDGTSRNAQAYVFANGRQQCSLELEFQVLKDGMPVTLTAAEIAKQVRLIPYAGSGVIGQGALNMWIVGATKGSYTWDEAYVESCALPGVVAVAGDQAGTPEASTPFEPGTQTTVLYISASAGRTQQMAVEILDDNGTSIAKSNWGGVPDDGYGKDGKFNSSVVVEAVEFRQPDILNYGDKIGGDANVLQDYLKVGSENKGTRSYEQYITLTHYRRRINWRKVERTIGGTPRFSVWVANGETKYGCEWSITYVIQPTEKTWRYGTANIMSIEGTNHARRWYIEQLFRQFAPDRATADPSKVVIGQVMGNDNLKFCTDSPHSFVADRWSEEICLEDEFGNDHYLTLYLPNSSGFGFNYVAIRTSSASAAAAAAAAGQGGMTWCPAHVDPRIEWNITVEPVGRMGAYRVAAMPRVYEHGASMPLTQDELASIQLIDYESMEPIPYDQLAGQRPNVTWVSGGRQTRLHADAAGGAGGAATRFTTADGDMTTSWSVAPKDGATMLNVAISILLRNGVTYRSNGWCAGPNDVRPIYIEDLDAGAHYLRSRKDINRLAAEAREAPVDVESAMPQNFSVNRINIVPQQKKVYANGRQQIRLAVTVETRQDGQPIPLTDTEIASITLIDHMTGEDLSTGIDGWHQDAAYIGFDFYPSLPGNDQQPDAPGNTVFVYLGSGPRALNHPLDIGFRITMRDGSAYASTGYYTPPGGTAYYDSSFDVTQNIDVTAVEPVAHRAEAYILRRKSLSPVKAGRRAGIFNDRVDLSVQYPDGNTVKFWSISCTPVGMIHWQTRIPGDAEPCFTGYASRGDTAVHWDPRIWSVVQPVPDLPEPVADSAFFILCGRVGIPRADHPDLPQDRIVVETIDAYGSSNRFTLAFVEGSRDELVVL